MKVFTLLAVAIPTALAFKRDGQHLARAPIPTPAPQPFQVGAMLDKRLVSSDTCGWISGSLASAVTCSIGFQCATNPVYTAFGCCLGFGLESCTLPTTCLDSTAAIAAILTADAFTYLCVGSAAPSCQTYNFPGGYKGFGCGTFNTAVPVSTSVAGNVAGGVTTAFSITGPVGKATAATSAFAAPQQTRISSGSSSSSSSNDSASVGVAIGAIVGIAIGGFVALAAVIGFGIWLCIRHKKRKQRLAASQAAYSSGPPPPPPPGPQQMASLNYGPGSQAGNTWVTGFSGPQSPGGANTQSHVSSTGQPMTQSNMNSMLSEHQSHQSGEWEFMQKPVLQSQTAAVPEDGIRVTEIRPEEAVDEQRPQQQQQPGQQYVMAGGIPPSHPGSPPPPSHSHAQTGVQSQVGGYSQVGGGYSQVGGYSHVGQPAPARTDIMSTMAPTAVAPTAISHNVQNV